nr:hypothetical protein TQ38_17495 [Novosphingobium sp. P6W]
MVVAGVSTAVPVSASVDTSPRPGGVFKLKPGIYVQKGTDCGSPPNAAIRRYDGKGISTPNTHACVARVLSRKGQSYSVRQSCIDTGVGKGPRITEKQVVDVSDALTFKLRTRGAGTSYRYCPAYMLPKDLRGGGK